MAMSFSPSPEAVELVDHLLNGRLSDDQLARLDQLLNDDPRLQRYLLEMCQFHALLNFDSRAQRVIDRVIAHRTAAPPAATASGPPLQPQPSLTAASPRPSFRSLGLVASMAVAATLLIAGGTLVSLHLMRPRVDTGPIAGVDDTRLPEVNAIQLGPQLTELQLASIGSVVIDGPSDFELIGPMRARLTSGKIKFRVTDERGHGFVVETPYGEITDLGTEFGIDVERQQSTSLVVFDGEVDLRVKNRKQPTGPQESVERLFGGEGVVINAAGEVDRLMSIFTGQSATFNRYRDTRDPRPVIIEVRDNLRSSDTRNYYEIVPGGLREDALAYVDRPNHEWNGINEHGIPPYLKGADYIKPFNNDKRRTDFRLEVTLSVPAEMYLFFDDRIPPPDWLVEGFEDTGDDIGIDVGPWRDRNGTSRYDRVGFGPGQWVDLAVSVWRRKVTTPGVVVLGPNSATTTASSMYGICAIATDR